MSHEAFGQGTAAARRRMRWYLRVPLKWAMFSAVTFLVLFPDPCRFARHLTHVRNMEAMVDPAAPELARWDAELSDRLKAHRSELHADPSTQPHNRNRMAAAEVQRIVERFVYDKVPYTWDWDQWGCADYMPTVGEMFARAAQTDGVVREDCDGRAVMAASLMERLGYKARLVTDLRHVWVATSQGEWMNPGRAKTVVATRQGNRVNYASALSNVPVSLSFGVAVFPFVREMTILLAAFVLMLRPGISWRSAAWGGMLLVQGLLFMRLGYLAPRGVSSQVQSWPALVGLAHTAVGFASLMWPTRRVSTRV